MRLSCSLCKFQLNKKCGRKNTITKKRCELFQYYHILNPHDVTTYENILEECLNNIHNIKFSENIFSETICKDSIKIKYDYRDNAIYLTDSNKKYKLVIDVFNDANKDLVHKYKLLKRACIGNFYKEEGV